MIKHAYGLLSEAEKYQLMNSFNEMLPDFIILDDGIHFLGVHCGALAQLEVIEQGGEWFYGRIRV